MIDDVCVITDLLRLTGNSRIMTSRSHNWKATMQSVQVRDAKAKFSALVEAAERGEPTTITRHGRPAAVMVSVEDARRLYPDDGASFADLLLAYPGGLTFERDHAPPREIDL